MVNFKTRYTFYALASVVLAAGMTFMVSNTVTSNLALQLAAATVMFPTLTSVFFLFVFPTVD